MRLNGGKPVWHASVSVSDRIGRKAIGRDATLTTQRLAVLALYGVGGEMEWWLWNGAAGVGHLRVPTTVDEVAICGLGNPLYDAGPSGTYRRRSMPPATVVEALGRKDDGAEGGNS